MQGCPASHQESQDSSLCQLSPADVLFSNEVGDLDLQLNQLGGFFYLGSEDGTQGAMYAG